jgi:hypothetical protein
MTLAHKFENKSVISDHLRPFGSNQTTNNIFFFLKINILTPAHKLKKKKLSNLTNLDRLNLIKQEKIFFVILKIN